MPDKLEGLPKEYQIISKWAVDVLLAVTAHPSLKSILADVVGCATEVYQLALYAARLQRERDEEWAGLDNESACGGQVNQELRDYNTELRKMLDDARAEVERLREAPQWLPSLTERCPACGALDVEVFGDKQAIVCGACGYCAILIPLAALRGEEKNDSTPDPQRKTVRLPRKVAEEIKQRGETNQRSHDDSRRGESPKAETRAIRVAQAIRDASLRGEEKGPNYIRGVKVNMHFKCDLPPKSERGEEKP